MADIKLTLDGVSMPTPQVVPQTELAKVEEDKQAAVQFTPEEEQMISDFSKQIDVTDPNLVFAYGSSCQQNIAQFSDSALASVRTKDMSEVGDILAGLVVELKGFDTDDDDKGILGWFRKGRNKIEALKARYDEVEVNVNSIVTALETHQVTLLKDISILEQLYEQNLSYFKELSMYIEAGKRRLEEVRATDLVNARSKAENSGLPEDAQKANDFAAQCDRFEKKIYDLELTRMVSIQMAPQIRLVQNNDTVMVEKIQSTIVNTIPLWKSQMVIALGLAHSEQALEAQRAVTDMTNKLLKKNAERLHQTTVSVAREAERGVVDIETLVQTNQELISTLDEVQQIQKEGREKRHAAEAELGRMEQELKNKLLNIGK